MIPISSSHYWEWLSELSGAESHKPVTDGNPP
jgi:hypothetical protein